MITINSKAIAVEDLSFPFNADSGKYWQYNEDDKPILVWQDDDYRFNHESTN